MKFTTGGPWTPDDDKLDQLIELARIKRLFAAIKGAGVTHLSIEFFQCDGDALEVEDVKITPETIDLYAVVDGYPAANLLKAVVELLCETLLDHNRNSWDRGPDDFDSISGHIAIDVVAGHIQNDMRVRKLADTEHSFEYLMIQD
jgi:hypothetical protein